MNKKDLIEFEENNPQEISKQKELTFECPNCGTINQEEIIFLCNKCDSKEMIYKDGFYLCPACLTKKDQKFMCNICDSTEVKLKSKI